MYLYRLEASPRKPPTSNMGHQHNKKETATANHGQTDTDCDRHYQVIFDIIINLSLHTYWQIESFPEHPCHKLSMKKAKTMMPRQLMLIRISPYQRPSQGRGQKSNNQNYKSNCTKVNEHNKIWFNSFSIITKEDLIPDGNDSDPDYKEPSDYDSSEEKNAEYSSEEDDAESSKAPTRKDVSAPKKKKPTKPVLLTKKQKSNTQTRKPRSTKKVTEEGEARQSNYILNVILTYQFCYKFNTYNFHILLPFQNSIANTVVSPIAAWEVFTTMCQHRQIMHVQGYIFRELRQPQ